VIPVMKRQAQRQDRQPGLDRRARPQLEQFERLCGGQGRHHRLHPQARHELGPDGINVNAIAPSITLTERIRPHWDKRSQASQAEEIERTPLRRVAEAARPGNVICFLASADADFVTGLTIDVTGGV
jgi:hypothetical protein